MDVVSPLPRIENLSPRKSSQDKVLALANMGTWYWTIGQSQIEFSDTLYEIFDVNADLFNADFASLRELIAPRDLAKLFLRLNDMLDSGADTSLTLRMIKQDDQYFYVQCYASCEMDQDGKIIALYGIVRDITDEKDSQVKLEEALVQAEEANKSKAGFLATMSHELRTPLNAIIGFSEMMQAELLGPLGNHRYSDYVNCIHESGRHLLELINDILDMSKIESGKYELFHEPVNVVKSVRLALHMIEAQAEEKEIEIIFNAPEDLPSIEADRRAFMQIVLNILSNAVKFTREKGAVTVNVSVDNGETIIVSITDTGIGIPADKIEAVTRPFEQVSNAMTRQHQGTGLGLAITKRLIEFHGGVLGIESRLDEGTTVTVTMPIITPQKQFDLFRSVTTHVDD